MECRWLCQLLNRSGSEASHRKVRKLNMRSVRQGSPLANGVKVNGERPDLAYQKTFEVFRDFGSLAGRFPRPALP